MGKLNITRDQCNIFPGGWSIKPEEMYTALSSVEYTDVLRILEFGAGDGTRALVKLLTDTGVGFEYTSYENDALFAVMDPRVHTVMWRDMPTKLEQGIFDLVIIDGPMGLDRCKWYPLVAPMTHKGTIIVVDDYHHFTEFKVALDKHFTHDVIQEHLEAPIPGAGQVSWVVTRVI